MLQIFKLLDSKTLFRSVGAVCQKWRQITMEMRGVQLRMSEIRPNSSWDYDEHILSCVSTRFPRMNAIDCRSCWRLEALPINCRELTIVNFHDCCNITNDAVVCLAKSSPNLTTVDFGRCCKLRDLAVVALANNCQNT